MITGRKTERNELIRAYESEYSEKDTQVHPPNPDNAFWREKEHISV